jgi:hypothetical protein
VPVVHHSVLEKMKSGADGYAPLGLPSEFRVFPSDGTGWVGLTPSGLQRDTGAVEAVRRMIWWRAQTNWLTIGLVGVLAAMPLVEGRLGRPDEPGLVVRGLSAVIGGLVPGWALTWVDSLLRLWWLTLPVVLALWAIYSFNQSLAYRIRDTGRRLWRKAG